MKHKCTEISMATVYCSAFFLLLASVVLTIVFWFRWYYSVPSLFLIGYASFKAYKRIIRDTVNDKPLEVDATLVIVLSLIPLWLIFVGIGGFIGQEQFDNSYRNAVLYELVNKSWPVTQIVDGKLYYLSYYFTYWLPVALVGKLFHSMTAAYVGLVIYAWLWLSLTVIMVMHFCGNRRKIVVALMLMCFMPPTIINRVCFQYILHWYNGGTDPAPFGSPTMLYNCTYIYNQSLPIIMAIPLMIRMNNHPGVVAMCLSMIYYYGPLETLPIIPVVALLIFRSIKCIMTAELWSSIILAGLASLFFLGNTNGTHINAVWHNDCFSPYQIIVMLIAYILVSIMLLMPLLWHRLGRSVYFLILLASTLVCTLIMPQYGNYDFGWKCPVALMFIVNMELCKLCSTIKWRSHKATCLLLGCIFIASIASSQNLYRNASRWSFNHFFDKDSKITRAEYRYGRLFEYDINNPVEVIVSASFIKQADTLYARYLMP